VPERSPTAQPGKRVRAVVKARRARRRVGSLRRAQSHLVDGGARLEFDSDQQTAEQVLADVKRVADRPVQTRPHRRIAAARAAAADVRASTEVVVPVQPSGPRPGLRKLRTAFLHPGKGQLIAAVILLLVGMAGVMQIRINTSDSGYRTARREDLIQLLDGLGAESRRLESEIADLERTRTSLQSGADSRSLARTEAEKRIQELSILAGTVPAQGSGIRMRIADPAGKVDAEVLLNAVEELRDAGAEVIEINNSVRVVATTWFGQDNQGGLLVDGTPVARPIIIEAIGDPHSLQEAAFFRGGIVSEITGPRIGGQVQVDPVGSLTIDSLHAATENQYARPASAAPTPR
jgi:uncharacterized protein YlxW (UPF0749 family)